MEQNQAEASRLDLADQTALIPQAALDGIVLFVAIVASWLFLPSSPDEQTAGHSSVANAAKANRTV